MSDISLIQSLIPSVDEQITKLQYAVTEYPDYTFNFTSDQTFLSKSQQLGISIELSHLDRYNYSLDPLTYLNMKITEMLDRLVEGLINQCNEHETKKVNILLPEKKLKEQYFYVSMREDRIILGGFIRFYFD